MAMATGGKRGVMADINVTPLVDVVLVLLIIFMVVTPMLQRGKDVKLPIATKQKDQAEAPDPVIVSITPDKRIWLEKDPVSDDQLKQALAGKIAAEPWKPILVKGDQSLTFGDVRRVLKDAQDAKAKSVKLGVEEK
ncbi:MAG TPA: biopolymer transporter ExbD [Myxococcaceae bacterium]|nr:biopolymer transporter ExbD [Myxococcaceae bacterium]